MVYRSKVSDFISLCSNVLEHNNKGLNEKMKHTVICLNITLRCFQFNNCPCLKLPVVHVIYDKAHHGSVESAELI